MLWFTKPFRLKTICNNSALLFVLNQSIYTTKKVLRMENKQSIFQQIHITAYFLYL